MDIPLNNEGEHRPGHQPTTTESAEETSLHKRQQLLAHHVRLLARKLSVGLFCHGSGGTGKSRTILNTLEAEGIDPVLINSHITLLSLYSTLFIHREERVILFDDVDSMYSSMPHLGLLRSALWGNPTRIVTYGSSQLPSDLPPSFETTARFIFVSNVIPKKNSAFVALLSRCDCVEISASNEEVIEMMRTLSAKGFNGLTVEDCAMVIDYIAENADDRQLSLRLLGPSLRKLNYARAEGIDWRPLIKSQLSTLGRKTDATKRLDSKNRDLRQMQQALLKHPDSIKDQQDYWCKATQKSRASFYRVLSRFRDEQGD